MNRLSRTAFLLTLALLLVAAVLMAGCTQTQPLTVQLGDHPTYGKILTDSNGRSLYIIARDTPNTGIIADLGEVARFYPPFFAESMPGERGINTTEFGILTRPDGKKQTTFRGWPLYYYLNDRAAGDAKSQGANNNTFLARPDYTVMVLENVSLGVYLTTPAGLTLYASDSANISGDATGYLPFHTAPIVGPSPLVQSGDFSEVTGPNGVRQTAFQARPLWLYSSDRAPGMIAVGPDGLRPVVLAPSGSLNNLGEAPTAAPSPTPTATAAAGTAGSAPTLARTTAAGTARSADDPYTGGAYTPTPFRTVHVVSQSTETVAPGVTWTPVVTGTTTAPGTVSTTVPSGSPTATTLPATLTPVQTVTTVPTPTSVPATTVATSTPATTVPTTNPVTTLPPTSTPATTVPTTNPVTTLPPTSAPTTILTTVPIPGPTTQATTISTTLPNPLPLPTTLPMLPPMPIASEGLGNGTAS